MLLALSLLEESFPRELARLLEIPVNGVQQDLRRLEADGLVAGRAAGRTRLYRIDPRYFARAELGKYLRRIAKLRRRPRRAGKPFLNAIDSMPFLVVKIQPGD